MEAYLIAGIKLLDASRYAEYVKAARPIVCRYGGRYLIRGGKTLPFSGE